MGQLRAQCVHLLDSVVVSPHLFIRFFRTSLTSPRRGPMVASCFDYEVFGQSFLKHFWVAASCSNSQSRHDTPDSSAWHRQGETAPAKKRHSEHCATSLIPYMTLSRTACPILILIVFAWHLDHDDATCARLISQKPKTFTSASIRRSSVMHQLIMSLRGSLVKELLQTRCSCLQASTRRLVRFLGNQCAASRLTLLFAASVQRPPRQSLQSVTSSQARPTTRTTNAAKTVLWRFALFDANGQLSKLGLRFSHECTNMFRCRHLNSR